MCILPNEKLLMFLTEGYYYYLQQTDCKRKCPPTKLNVKLYRSMNCKKTRLN